MFEPVFDWWWLIAPVAALAILRGVTSGKRSRRKRRRPDPPFTKGGRPPPVRSQARPRPPSAPSTPLRTIAGKAYVTDGDGMRVAGQEVRLAGLDSPEHDQKAKHRHGYWFNHGKRVKSALIREIGGKHVQVSVERTDRFGRLVGTVTREGRDIGEWLVREGHAIAAHDERYNHAELAARRAKHGMWEHAHNFDPRAHRNRKPPCAVDRSVPVFVVLPISALPAETAAACPFRPGAGNSRIGQKGPPPGTEEPAAGSLGHRDQLTRRPEQRRAQAKCSRSAPAEQPAAQDQVGSNMAIPVILPRTGSGAVKGRPFPLLPG